MLPGIKQAAKPLAFGPWKRLLQFNRAGAGYNFCFLLFCCFWVYYYSFVVDVVASVANRVGEQKLAPQWSTTL